MKKILMVDNCETESNVGDPDDTPDDQIGGDSSKSNSITSEHSMQSIGGIVASSQSSSSNSIPPNIDQQGNLTRNSSRSRLPPSLPPHHPQPQYVNAIPGHFQMSTGHINVNHHHHIPQLMQASGSNTTPRDHHQMQQQQLYSNVRTSQSCESSGCKCDC